MQQQARNEKFNLDNVQFFFDREGNPSSVIVPFDLFKKAFPQAENSVYNLSTEDIVSAVNEVRDELYKETYETENSS